MKVTPVCVHDRPLESKAQLDGELWEVPAVIVYTLWHFHLPYAESHDWQSDGWTMLPHRQYQHLWQQQQKAILYNLNSLHKNAILSKCRAKAYQWLGTQE